MDVVTLNYGYEGRGWRHVEENHLHHKIPGVEYEIQSICFCFNLLVLYCEKLLNVAPRQMFSFPIMCVLTSAWGKKRI